MSGDIGIGKLITGVAHRDAIHVAVAPVIAGAKLFPGKGVGFEAGSTERVQHYGTTFGIVDPFLTAPVEPGQRCYVFLYPGSITSLRHEWTHPAFTAQEEIESPKGASEEWLRNFADECGLHYGDLMDGAKDWIDGGEYLIRGGLLEGVGVPEAFWHHYEVVTDSHVHPDKRESFFSCSC